MSEMLATVDDVANRIGEPIDGEVDRRLAESMIEAATAHVRHYGAPWPSRSNAPAVAKTITIMAAARGYMNPSGFIDERSDSVTLRRAEAYAADTQLTPREIEMLREAADKGSAGSVASVPIFNGGIIGGSGCGRHVSPYGFVRRDVHECVPMEGSPTPFPFYRGC